GARSGTGGRYLASADPNVGPVLVPRGEVAQARATHAQGQVASTAARRRGRRRTPTRIRACLRRTSDATNDLGSVGRAEGRARARLRAGRVRAGAHVPSGREQKSVRRFDMEFSDERRAWSLERWSDINALRWSNINAAEWSD